MSVEAEPLLNYVQAVVGDLDALELRKLENSTGYAYEAFIMVVIGNHLTASGQVHWHHPQPHTATFTNSRGRPAGRAASALSHLCSTDGPRALPSVEVRGRSDVLHSCDVALIDWPEGGCPGKVGEIEDDRSWSEWCRMSGVIECKNVGRAPSLGLARDLLGLALELWEPALFSVGLYPWRWGNPMAEAILCTSLAPSIEAERVFNHWGVTVRTVLPPEPDQGPSLFVEPAVEDHEPCPICDRLTT